MKKNLAYLFFCLSSQIFAQSGDYTVGARSSALANTSVTIEDEWSVFNNIGALSYVQETSVIGTYKSMYKLPELSTIALGAATPLFNGTVGLSVFRFGGEELNEHRASLGFSNQFGLVSLGASAGYYQISIEGGGTRRAFLFDFGGHAKLSDQFIFAAHASNINQAKLSVVNDERIPTLMKTGLSYRPTERLMLNTEVQKSIESDAQIKFGIEYEIIDQIYARMGFGTEPFTSHFGLGINLDKFKVDYSFVSHPDLGDSHQFSFIYVIML